MESVSINDFGIHDLAFGLLGFVGGRFIVSGFHIGSGAARGLRLLGGLSERLREIQGANKGVADSSKLALLAALSFVAELEKEKAAHRTTQSMIENKTDRLSRALRESLEAGAPPAETP